MEQSTAALALAIGARVKQERQARQWTLDRLAEAAAVSRRMVVNVEQGAVNPSVGTLLRISDALGVGLPALVEPPEPRRVRVTRRGEGATLWSREGGGGGRARPSGAVRPAGEGCSWPAPSHPTWWSCGTGPSAPGTSTSARRTRRAP